MMHAKIGSVRWLTLRRMPFSFDRFARVVALGAVTACCLASAPEPTRAAVASAGIGFMLPTSLASDSRGNLYIVDSGAQRVDVMRANGTVEPLAGYNAVAPHGLWSFGGFADGPAALARLRHPAGVAVGPDGAIYVADTYNHCIRRIAGGAVTTYAGKWDVTDAVDGTLATARMRYPKSIAFDPSGTMYVADFFSGVRRITRDGKVDTIKIPVIGNRPVSVSAYATGGTTYLFASDDDNVVGINLKDGQANLWSDSKPPADTDPSVHYIPLEGEREPGHFSSIVALGSAGFAYTDAASGDVRVINGASVETIPTQAGPLSAPLGIARDGEGRLALTDSGHRRILTVPMPDLRSYVQTLPPERAPGTYRITVVGNSFTFWNTLWATSVPGQIETKLRRDAASVALAKKADVVAVRLGPFPGIADYILNDLTDGETDAVVLQLNPAFIYTSYNVPWGSNLESTAPKWQAPLLADLGRVVDGLAKAHVPLLVTVHPLAVQSGPLEELDTREGRGGGVSDEDDATSYPAFLKAIASAHVPHLLDLGADFYANEASATRIDIFEPRDFHFSPQGRAFVGTRVAAALEKMAPWRGK